MPVRWLAAICLCWLGAPAAFAQPVSVGPGGQILHEKIPPDPSFKGGTSDDPVVVLDEGAQPSDDAQPLDFNGGDGSEPGTDGPTDPNGPLDPNGEELIYGGDPDDPGVIESDGRDASGRVELDRQTEKEGQLEYHTVFDPSVVPFKRNSAKDAVDADAALVIGDPGLLPVQIGGYPLEPDREIFWGSMLIELSPGDTIPIPSVAPHARILEVSLTPPTRGVQFYRDSADNFYVMGDRVEGRFRLQFAMDAPTGYFGRAAPTGWPLGRAQEGLAPRQRPLPASLAPDADTVARAVGIQDVSTETFDGALNKLVRYFRGFAPGEPPAERASVYRDVALGQTGVCRHRAHSFVITAAHVGIASRYVANEAHVFVEVWVPGPAAGWMRIDLGGGAEGLTVYGGEERQLHQPSAADPFGVPRTDPSAAGGREYRPAGADSVTGMPAPESGAPPAGVGAGGGPAAPGGDGPPVDVEPIDASGRMRTFTSLQIADASVVRGESLACEGQVQSVVGSPVAGASVVLWLVPRSDAGEPVSVGGAVTSGDGSYRISAPIPRSLQAGRYNLVARCAGDDEHAPSESR